MVAQQVKIINEQGLHMRPAGILAKEMSTFKSEVMIECNGKTVNGKSVIHIIAACIKYGSEINIQCTGEDEQEALQKAIELVASGFGE